MTKKKITNESKFWSGQCVRVCGGQSSHWNHYTKSTRAHVMITRFMVRYTHNTKFIITIISMMIPYKHGPFSEPFLFWFLLFAVAVAVVVVCVRVWCAHVKFFFFFNFVNMDEWMDVVSMCVCRRRGDPREPIDRHKQARPLWCVYDWLKCTHTHKRSHNCVSERAHAKASKWTIPSNDRYIIIKSLLFCIQLFSAAAAAAAVLSFYFSLFDFILFSLFICSVVVVVVVCLLFCDSLFSVKIK